MNFFKTRVFIASVFFLLGLGTDWLWLHRTPAQGPTLTLPEPQDPFAEIHRLQEQMLKSFPQEDFGMGGQVGALNLSSPEITEDDKNYYLSVETKGMKPKDFSVQSERGQLEIQGTLTSDNGQMSTHFSRSLPLPPGVNADGIQVDTKDERILVTIPKGL